MTKEQDFFKKKSIVATFGIIALLAGFYFVNTGALIDPLSGQVTGNAVITGLYPFSALSLVGMLLILCSAILIIYAIAKRD